MSSIPLGPTNITGGAVYTRWGRTVCPTTPGTELVYSGVAAGSYYGESGGGANYLCLPNDPQALLSRAGSQGLRAKLQGVDYATYDSFSPLSNVFAQNVPCAVCYTSQRPTKLMIPAKPTCPSSWTLEYAGYLMGAHRTHNRVAFECVDKDPQSVPNTAGFSRAAEMFLTETNCNGIPCHPYDRETELSCAVCTR